MKEVKRYESDDGEIFESEQKCKKHEQLKREIELIMSKLEPLPKSSNCNFDNGDGYIQQDKETVNAAMIELVKLSKINKSYINDDFYLDPFKYRNSVIGRVFNDGYELFYKQWYRFMCMNDKYEEWVQPYYANHPDKGNYIKRN